MLSDFQWVSRLELFHFMLIATFVDIVTGYVKAFVFKRVDSSVGAKGLTRHFMTVFVYLLAGAILKAIDMEGVYYGGLMLVIFNDLVSIVENLGVIGVPVPSGIKKRVQKEVKKLMEE